MTIEEKYPGWDSLPEWASWELSRFALYAIGDADVAIILTSWLSPRLVFRSSWEYGLFLEWCSEHGADPDAARLEDIVAERHPDVLRDDLHFLLYARMYSLHPDYALLRADPDTSYREQKLTEMMMDRLPEDTRARMARAVQYTLALCSIAHCHPRNNEKAVLSAGEVQLIHYSDIGPWVSIASNPHIGPCPFGEGDIMDKLEALWEAAVAEYGYESPEAAIDSSNLIRAFKGDF